MSGVELRANIFRIIQTKLLLEKQKLQDEQLTTDTHYNVGKAVRSTIIKLRGTTPENLSMTEKSIKEIEKDTVK